jgi:YegS/Rv2252/BmrU family lipid kinase
MKLKLILNPAAGSGRANHAVLAAREHLDAAGIEYSLDISYRRGGATTLVQKALDLGFDTFLVIGGDGTINEVVNGMADKDATLGIIPAGRGNDFAKMLGISKEAGSACRSFIEGGERRVDLGELNQRYFVNGVGIGFDAEVAVNADQWAGKSAYYFGILRTILRFKPLSLKIKFNGLEPIVPLTMITVANGRYFGGGFILAPEALPNDGLFDVCMIGKMSKLKMLKNLGLVRAGAHTALPEFLQKRAAELCIQAERPTLAHMDGEIIEAQDFQIKIHPGKLKLKCGLQKTSC